MGNLNTIVQKVFHLNMPLHQICASTVIYWPPKWVACVPLLPPNRCSLTGVCKNSFTLCLKRVSNRFWATLFKTLGPFSFKRS